MARSRYSKAWAAGLAGGVVAAAAAAIPFIDDGLTASEVLTILVAFLSGSGITGGVTYAAPANAPKGGGSG